VCNKTQCQCQCQYSSAHEATPLLTCNFHA